MSSASNLVHAFVLHRCNYRESSLLVDFLTSTHGRIKAVVKGARRKRGIAPEPFAQYRISWRGRGPLMTITSVEATGSLRPSGSSLYAGLYLNELLMRSTRPAELLDGIYAAYKNALASLTKEGMDLEVVLRGFERNMLKALGYEVLFDWDCELGTKIDPDQHYHFELGKGLCAGGDPRRDGFPGGALLSVAEGNLDGPVSRRAAKYILRKALRPLIGEAPLESRELLRARAHALHRQEPEAGHGSA